MARRDPARAQTPPRALTIAETLAKLVMIDRSLDAMCQTAPRAVDALGGRDAIQACSHMTCIGPVPRLTADEWEPLATEHADGQRNAARPKDFYIDQTHRA